MRVIKARAQPRMNYHRSSTNPELPEETLDLLGKYLQLAPAMVPPAELTHSPTLWHPDLHLDNVFVDPETKQITRIIDWQSAAVMPLFYQRGVPVMFKHPGPISDDWVLPKHPEGYDGLEESEKARIDIDQRSQTCHKYYLAETSSTNATHWAALQLKDVDVRTEPSRLVQNVWECRDVFFFRRALIEIVEQWHSLCPERGPCPVKFSKQELASHETEEESLCIVSEILSLFREKWDLPSNGMVPRADFDRIQTALAELRDSFIEDADDEAERAARIWPYQDTDDC